LREVLGDHVEQKGSAVHSKYLRFDFSHFSKITSKELKEVERFVNARIEEKLSLEENRTLPMEQAILDGAIALFGEKYSDVVRTIRFGNSIELCGGTHVKNTADIWHFKIKSEGAVASGIRRIEAITNDSAKEYYAKNNTSFEQVKLVLNNSSDPVKSISDLKSENSKLKKQIESLLKDKALSMKGDLKLEVTLVNGVHFLAKKVDLDASGIKDLSFELGQQFENSLLLFGTEQNGKALLSCYVSKQLVVSKGLNAGTIVRELGRYIEGGGGGQPFYATAGGNNPAGLQQALNKAKSYIE
jgi:alanyl-tRNA synthetase